MITRADVEAKLAEFNTQEEQHRGVENWLRLELPANPVVNGPLQEYMNSERIDLVDVILADLHTYQNWIKYERPAAKE